jgi:hypothetical protein
MVGIGVGVYVPGKVPIGAGGPLIRGSQNGIQHALASVLSWALAGKKLAKSKIKAPSKQINTALTVQSRIKRNI